MTAERGSGRPILVLGGTAEARELATALHGAGLPVVSSLAGRVSSPSLPPGDVRIGGFGSADGLAGWLTEQHVAAVIDATHPFAAQISEATVTACARSGLPLLRLDRPGWTERPGDRWHRVADLRAAADLTPRLGRRVFLSIGRQGVGAFASVESAWCLIRCIEPPEPPLPPHHQILLDRGPYTLAGELALLQCHAIDVLVTRDSGGALTEPKLEAARHLGIPVIMVRRPPRPNVETVTSVAESATWAAAAVHRAASPSEVRASRSR